MCQVSTQVIDKYRLAVLHLMLLDQTIEQRLGALGHAIARYVINLNLFPTYPPANDQRTLHNQYLSTRVFIFLLILTSTVLFIYTAAVQSIQIVAPSTADYTEYKLSLIHISEPTRRS